MPRRQYNGPHDGVDLVGVGTVKQGQTVNVPASIAKNLGPDWSAPKPKSRKSRGTTNTPKEG